MMRRMGCRVGQQRAPEVGVRKEQTGRDNGAEKGGVTEGLVEGCLWQMSEAQGYTPVLQAFLQAQRMWNGEESGEHGSARQPQREGLAWCRETSRAALWDPEVSTLHRLATDALPA
ncbi:hypothetical protein NDU88_002395 [Pleurodeles waltl]|uniref:Uncharacterized protein n=1 Tax=Pleurodeles waltl TaxID=8319 RepID=A0AAV7NDM9_PLEWA|nr:hypothetical protein NDU88_002395 [Pleurodeles waltl]